MAKPTVASNAIKIEELHKKLFGSNLSITALSTKMDNQAASTEASLAELSARLDTFSTELKVFGGRTDVPAPTKHRKHHQLAGVIKDIKLRIAQLEAVSPGQHTEAVNAEIARLNSRIDNGYADLDGRLATVEGLVADHGLRLDLVDPTLAAHTAELEELGSRVDCVQADIVRVEAMASANASATRGAPNWGLGLVVGVITAIAAGLVFHYWVDASDAKSWVATGIGFVSGLWVGSSFESAGSMAASAHARAASMNHRPVAPAPPAPQAGNNPTTTLVPVTATSASAGTAV